MVKVWIWISCTLMMFYKCLSDKDGVFNKSPMNEKFLSRSSRYILGLSLHDSWQEQKTWAFEKCFIVSVRKFVLF
jgi:hypothetical protein